MLRKIEEKIVGSFLFPLTNSLYNRRGILASYRALKRSEYFESERLAGIRLEKLKNLVIYAYDRVPFYRKRFDEVGLEPADIKSLDDIKFLPTLTRQEVIDHHHDMLDDHYREQAFLADLKNRATGAPIPLARFRNDRLVRNTSSGSTGAPTVFYEDGSRSAVNWAHELRFRSWFGINPGVREARMARVSVEYLRSTPQVMLRRMLWNQLPLPGVNLGDEDYKLCYENLQSYHPRVLWGFTSALDGLCQYIDKTGMDPEKVRPDLVISWAAPLYEHEEEMIRKVLKCNVTNIYGARETGHIAARCPAGTYHINEENILLEVESEGINGDSGELIATTLDISVMPFIRYRMGDIGKVSPSRCDCGRTLSSLDDLLGRTGEVFTTRSGRMISPNFWCRTFMNPAMGGKIERFQVVYRPDDNILFRIVKGPEFSQQTEDGLRNHLENNFRNAVKARFEYCEEIKPQISGKYQMVINETRGNENDFEPYR